MWNTSRLPPPFLPLFPSPTPLKTIATGVIVLFHRCTQSTSTLVTPLLPTAIHPLDPFYCPVLHF
jgi:hypothetical protein